MAKKRKKRNAVVRIIGDVHGYIHKYYPAIADVEYSIQLGDMGLGFKRGPQCSDMDDVDQNNHRILGGNHDNYDDLPPHFLGDFGLVPKFEKIFYVRGAYSIDKAWRVAQQWMNDPGECAKVENWALVAFMTSSGYYDKLHEHLIGYGVTISWWPQEQLSTERLTEAVALYEEETPEIVITHDCPSEVIKAMRGDNRFPNQTADALQVMFQIHQPKFWYFGHHHESWTRKINGTIFRCLNSEGPDRIHNKLEYIDIDPETGEEIDDARNA